MTFIYFYQEHVVQNSSPYVLILERKDYCTLILYDTTLRLIEDIQNYYCVWTFFSFYTFTTQTIKDVCL